MRARRGAGVLVLVLGVLISLAGCSRDHTLCAYADGLVKDARLTEAANAYAAATRAEEGDCADDGADEVADRRRTATKEVARAQAALSGGDRAAARAFFESALRTDKGDQAALQGLLLLGAPVTPAPVPTVVVHEVRSTSAPAWPFWATIAVATVALLTAGAVWWWGLKDMERVNAQLTTALRQVQEQAGNTAKEGQRVDARIEQARRTTLRLFRDAMSSSASSDSSRESYERPSGDVP
ncbi:hypothetical protein Aab01nite_78350 [Paractinoplanes abujensis]|uniref:Uncharacterized protein n=1 Tax=Paractinoplanes abujensis TaxID=882441 RepID=A0A7W7G1L9_9ACTN|nr:hypothetical protein [Actinoplanes abujensis]MBB4692275.1 hypothetical protein [Actinoplanes abujensis]GID24245.1 hypothetical protein Aab01nite_78350 [Actinoplanes abujensis]